MLKKINSLLICASALVVALTLRAGDLPAGTTIEARLLESTGSHFSRVGDPVQAVVIAPVFLDGQLVLPQGTIVEGVVARVQRFGYGLKQRTAGIGYTFEKLLFESGAAVPVETRLLEVETAKEHVDAVGMIGGIHPSVNLSSAVSFALPFLYETPLLLPAFAVKTLIARTPDPEIYLPAGTEIVLRLTDSVQISTSPSRRNGEESSFSAEEIEAVQRSLSDESKQQTRRTGGEAADLINIVFLGSSDQIARAFRASGWFTARSRSAKSLYCIYQGMVERIGDRKAPMSRLTLAGAPPNAVYEKGLDTFSKRHHIRLWKQPESGPGLWFSAATEDVAIRVRRMRLTHTADPFIDNERAKVLNDLAFAGCVDSATLVPRPGSLKDINDEGPIITDDDVAVIRLNDCKNPRTMPFLPAPEHGRAVRALIAFRNDVVRSNFVSAGYNTTRLFILRPAASRANGLFLRADAHRARHKPDNQTAWVRTSLLDAVFTHSLRAQ